MGPEIGLSQLVGTHVLTGVDRDSRKLQALGERFEDCEVLRFVLDGITYMAVQDPEDGYRSRMKNLVVTGDPVTNQFYPVDIVASMRLSDGDLSCNDDILDMRDQINGKVILSVGTRCVDDYYPYWVAEWHPELMAINGG